MKKMMMKSNKKIRVKKWNKNKKSKGKKSGNSKR